MINIDDFTRLALPENDYLTLYGAAICSYNQTVSLIIELITDGNSDYYLWARLNDDTKFLINEINKVFKNDSDLLLRLIDINKKRDRMIHSFQVTSKDKKQIMCTKEKNGNQYLITKEFLIEFIKELSDVNVHLDSLRMTKDYYKKIFNKKD